MPDPLDALNSVLGFQPSPNPGLNQNPIRQVVGALDQLHGVVGDPAWFSENVTPAEQVRQFMGAQARRSIQQEQQREQALRQAGSALALPQGMSSFQQYANSVRQANPLHDWDQVSHEFSQTFPGRDPEEARTQFNQAKSGQRLMLAMDAYRSRDRNSQDEWGRWLIQRTPGVGGADTTYELVNVRGAAGRIADGGGNSQDFQDVARFLVDAEESQNQTLMQQAGNIISHMPATMLEFAATGGVFSGVRVAATKGVAQLAGRSVARNIATRAAIYGAGIAAQTAAMPQNITAAAARRAVPGMDLSSGRLQLQDNGDLISNLPAGAADAAIEVGSERAGALLPVVGRLISKTPVLGTMLNSVQNRVVRSTLGQMMAQADNGVASTMRAIGHSGYHGVFGEIFEERVADALRGSLGLARTPEGGPDFGPVQAILTGRAGEGGQQLLAEAIAFSVLPIGHAAASRAVQGRGVSEQGAMQRLSRVDAAITDVLQQNPNAPKDELVAAVNSASAPGPVRDYGVAAVNYIDLHRQNQAQEVQPEITPQAEPTQAEQPAQITPANEPTQMPGFMRQAPTLEDLVQPQQAEIAGTTQQAEPAQPQASLKDQLLEYARQEQVVSIPELRDALPEQHRGEDFDKAIISLAEDGKVTLFKDASPESFSPSDLAKLVKDGNNYFSAMSAVQQTPKPEVAPSAARRTFAPDSLLGLMASHLQGEAIPEGKIEEVVGKIAKWTPKEKHVLFGRLNNRTFDDIAADVEMRKDDGKPSTKQNAQQIFTKALTKAKVPKSVRASLVDDARAAQKELAKEKAVPAALAGPTVANLDENAPLQFADKKYKASVEERDNLTEAWLNETDPVKQQEIAKKIGEAEEKARAAGVSYFLGRTPTQKATQAKFAGKVISPFEWIKTAFAWFKTPYTVGKVTGNESAAFLEHVRKVELSGTRAGSSVRAAHELGHSVIAKFDFPVDPAKLLAATNADVVRGFAEFDYDPNRMIGVQKIREGFSEWFRQRLTGEDVGTRTPAQDAAAAFGEKWLQDNGLTEIANRLRALSDNYNGADEELRARMEISPRGEQADATGLTKGESAKAIGESLAFQAQQNLDDNLRILTLAQEASGKAAPKGRDLRTVWSALRIMARSWSDSFAGTGMQAVEIDQNGNWTMKKIGEPLTWVIDGLGFTQEDLRAEGAGKLDGILRWMGLPVQQKASKLDTFMIALAAVREIDRGMQMLHDRQQALANGQTADAKRLLEEGERLVNTVEPRQAQIFREYLDKIKADNPDWYNRAEEALRRVAVLNDKVLTALESVGWYSKQDVKNMRFKYPNYIPMYRIVEGEEFKPNREMKRYGSGRQLVSPITALHSKYAEASYIFAKQLKDQALLEAGAQQAGPTGIGGYFVQVDDTPEVRQTDIHEILDSLGIPTALHQQVINIIGMDMLFAIQPKQWSETAPNLYSVRSKGQKITLRIDNKALYNLLTDIQVEASPTASLANKVAAIWPLHALKKLVTWGATQANLVFPIRNPIRDPYHYIQNEGASVESVKAWILGQKGALASAANQLFGRPMPEFDTIYQDATGQQLREFGYTTHSAGAKAFRALRGESDIEKPIWALHKVQEVLELIGFAEQGPRRGAFYRALEEMGYDRQTVNAAMSADPAKSPIPMHIMFYAVQRATEATVDFSRQGVFTKEYGKIAPFFSPQIAAMSQEIRNWEKVRQEGFIGPKSKAMIGTLAAYIGFELLHWWIYKDKEWYKNLPEHLRYNWWVLGQTSDGGTFGVPKPQGIMRMVGAYLQELLRSASGSNPRFALATASVVDQGTPRLLPIGASETLQVARNRDWRGMPIVPRRDEFAMGQWDQFRTHQLPYIMEQLTGGLASSRSLRLPTEAFQSSRSEPNLPVAEYYTELQRLAGERTRAMHANVPFAQEARYQRLHQIERRMQELAREARGERLVNGRVVMGAPPTAERLHRIRLEQIRLSALAMR